MHILSLYATTLSIITPPFETNTHTRTHTIQGFAAQLQTALQACGRKEGYDIILDALGGIYFKASPACLSVKEHASSSFVSICP